MLPIYLNILWRILIVSLQLLFIFLQHSHHILLIFFLLSLQEIAPYNGLGSIEDSLMSCVSLLPQPPRKDYVKMMENDHKILRFEARLVSWFDFRRMLISAYLFSSSSAAAAVIMCLIQDVCLFQIFPGWQWLCYALPCLTSKLLYHIFPSSIWSFPTLSSSLGKHRCMGNVMLCKPEREIWWAEF